MGTLPPVPANAWLSRLIRVADGRHVGFAETGDLQGRPLFYFHGTPSSRLDVLRISAAACRTGWRVIALDRPGHGISDPQRGRRVLDTPADVAAVADVLGLDEFALLGYSGGASHALGTAHSLRARVTRAAVVSAWGPIDQPRAYEGVRLIDRIFDRIVVRVPGLARLTFKASTLVVHRAPGLIGGPLAELTGGGGAEPAGGQRDPRRGPVPPFLEAFRRGTRGPVQDYRLLLRPWGFDPAGVGAPVHLWHGDADTTAPLHHGQYLLDHLPRARLTVVPGGDHAMFYRRVSDILSELIEAT